jgi:hypothetical protein
MTQIPWHEIRSGVQRGAVLRYGRWVPAVLTADGKGYRWERAQRWVRLSDRVGARFVNVGWEQLLRDEGYEVD